MPVSLRSPAPPDAKLTPPRTSSSVMYRERNGTGGGAPNLAAERAIHITCCSGLRADKTTEKKLEKVVSPMMSPMVRPLVNLPVG